MKLSEILEAEEPPRSMQNFITVPPDQERFDAMDTIDEIEGELLRQYMPRENPGDDPLARAKMMGQMTHEMRRKMGKVGTVPINKLKALETHLDPEHVTRLVNGGQSNNTEKLPVIYIISTGAYIGDGNHRVAAEHTKGNDRVKVLLLDFRKYEQTLQQRQRAAA